jgi:hypothetical protein
MLGKLPRNVSSNERISRFIFSKDHIKEKSGKREVMPAAFLPANDDKTSVYRTKSCSETNIWFLGYWYCEFLRNFKKRPELKPDSLRGRADVDSATVLSSGINFEYQPTPHFRHVDLAGWPPKANKDARKAMALVMAANANGIEVTPFKYRPAEFFKDYQ